MTWRDVILREFTPQVARLTLVADPDGLLLEEGILEGIAQRGFELIPFEDPIAFRFAYESRYRSRWDRAEATDLVVVLRAATGDLVALPFDLLQAGRRLAFSLGDLFPNLSYPVITALDRADLQALYEAQQHYSPGRLGDNATKDFVLRHVFGIAPELVKQPADLLRVLLRRHHQGLRIPRLLDDRLIHLLRSSGPFDDWPLEAVVPDRETFFAFLQERWRIHVDRLTAEDSAVREEPDGDSRLEYPGPEHLPFEHDDVRVLVDNLFLEGMLEPVDHPRAAILQGSWAAVGVRIDPVADRLRRWHGLLGAVNEALPAPEAPHQEWQAFAVRWAQLIALRTGLGAELEAEEIERFQALQSAVDSRFVDWVRERFGTLHNQPALPPVMLHHVPRQLARMLDEDGTSKVALVVMDGLSMDQWIVVEEVLKIQAPALRVREGSVFAWIPTLTTVSRQACFAGRPPLYFPRSIQTTDGEPKAWCRFWEDEGLGPAEIGYEKSIGDLGDLTRVDELTSRPRLRVLGLVVDKVDRIMHGMELGTAGMHNQVRQWMEQEVFARLLTLLLDRGFTVVVTADHGNIEAWGCGRPSEGSLADVRGERVRVFNSAVLRDRVHERFPAAIAWPPLGLPDDYLPLIAPGRAAFVREDEKVVAHGGITIEELVVPLVRIERK